MDPLRDVLKPTEESLKAFIYLIHFATAVVAPDIKYYTAHTDIQTSFLV